MAKFFYQPSLLHDIYWDIWKAVIKLCVQLNEFIEIHCTTAYTKVRWNSFHIFLLKLLCYIYRYTSIKIQPEPQKNILKFGYGINYKYEGMLPHSFSRFYAVTKFILPTMNDLKLSPINYDKECKEIKTLIKDLITYCFKLRPYIAFSKMQINVHNKTAHHILKNEVDLISPKFPEDRKSKRGILAQ